MFIGHFAPAFAMRAFNPQGPKLGALFVAAQAVDFGFFGFSLLGIERSTHDPSLPGLFKQSLDYMPFSHSLLPATLVWSVLGATLAVLLAPRSSKAAFGWGIGLVIASHWFCDLLVHRPDLGVLWETPKVGFGLWNYPIAAIALELTFLAIPALLYFTSRRFKSMMEGWRVIVLIIVLLAAQIFNWLSPAPVGLAATALPPLAVFTIFALIAMWADRNVAPKKESLT